MKFGIEKEAFVYNEAGEPCLVPPGIPQDDCGWLAEYRGLPCHTMREAVGSVLAEEQRVRELLQVKRLTPSGNDWLKLPRKLKLEARRHHTKGLLRYENLYDIAPTTKDTAGVHLSFTNPTTHHHEKERYTYNLLWDFVKLFKALDQRYKSQIKQAQRKPGFYEIKSDQRIEYRSLPASIDLWEVAAFIDSWKF